MLIMMTHSSALRFKSGKGRSIRINKIRAKENDLVKTKINNFRNIGE